jgi:protein subunit release factor B
MKTLLFSITANDCEWDYTRGSGKGGQKKNKTSSAVRCRHLPSGAIGYAEDSRSQHLNKRSAFVRMADTKEFKNWHKIEIARRTGELAEMERRIEKEIHNPKITKIEGKNEEGQWVNTIEIH